jgi:hypothetical protein
MHKLFFIIKAIYNLKLHDSNFYKDVKHFKGLAPVLSSLIKCCFVTFAPNYFTSKRWGKVGRQELRSTPCKQEIGPWSL